ncbi:MAG: TRAP transporter small permease [candidate division NC10 bacterium]|nr:TRAP transporter small permease [candidate division NC10 bacterium]
MNAPVSSGGFLERLGRLSGALGEVALAFMVVSICYDVLMRYVLLAPTIWALEVNTFLLVFLCAVPAADTLTAGTQIQVTFLTERLPEGLRQTLAPVGDVAGVLFSAVLTWKGFSMAWTAWQHNDRMSTSLGTPLWIPYLLLPVGFGLLGLTYAARLARGLSRRAARPGTAEPEVGQQI